MLATLPAARAERDLDDDALVTLTLAGSADAFETLVGRYRPTVLRVALRLTRDGDDASDVTQDVFLRAYRRLADYRPERSFARWLFAIARNASLDALRRRKRAALGVLEDVAAERELGPEDLAVRADESARVHVALEALPPKYRSVLEMHYVSDLRYREIAAALDIPIGTVKTYISRAKRRLRDELDVADYALAA